MALRALRWGYSFIIARGGIAATSLTTASFKWLHEEAWDDAAKNAYSGLKILAPVGLYASPSTVRVARRAGAAFKGMPPSNATVPINYGRWLLAPVDSPILGAADAVLRTAHFKTLWLTLVLAPGVTWEQAPVRPAVTLFISALMMLSAADQVRIVTPGHEDAGQVFGSGEFYSKLQLWTPYQSLARLAGSPDALRLAVLLLDPNDWWQQDFAAADRKTLSYLERRIASATSPEVCKKPARRPWWRLW